MPMCFVEAPQGLPVEAKSRLHEKLNRAVYGAYGIADIRTYIREYSLENAAQSGRADGKPIRPICILVGPQLRRLDKRRRLVAEITAALIEAYGQIANVDNETVFINEYASHDIGWLNRLHRVQPEVVERSRLLNSWVPAPPP